MVSWILRKVLGSKNQREIRRLRPLVEKINRLEQEFQTLSDDQLKEKTAQWKQELAKIDDPDELARHLTAILPEAFAAVKNTARRLWGKTIVVCDQPLVWNMIHFDVQLIGGIVLHEGKISEMATGEGKTLVATCPIYLNALAGRGVHLVTVNDYLARRDAEWMGEIYKFLGMSVGTIVHGQTDREKQLAYRSDITYGTNNEFGFDYLRDNMKDSIERYVQRELHYAIVDEVDSILVDEARTPLIISGPAEDSADLYFRVNQIIPSLKKDLDYNVDEKAHSVMLTD